MRARAHTPTHKHIHTYITVYIKYLELGIQRKHAQGCLILTLATAHVRLCPAVPHEDE